MAERDSDVNQMTDPKIAHLTDGDAGQHHQQYDGTVAVQVCALAEVAARQLPVQHSVNQMFDLGFG